MHHQQPPPANETSPLEVVLPIRESEPQSKKWVVEAREKVLDEEWITSNHRIDSDSVTKLSCRGFSDVVCLVWTQIVIVSFIVTLSRGTLNALNAVGGLGTADVQTATMVNLLSSLSFSCLSWMSGGVVNVIGPQIACAIGSITTTTTLTSLMLYTMLHVGPQWMVFVAATLDGIGSGILWTASGTITIKYPSEQRKGFASTVLFAIYSCGAALGGLMAFVMNINQVPVSALGADPGNEIPPSVEDNFPLVPVQNTGLEPTSYSIMIGLAVVALMLSSLIVPESRVRNFDGSKVENGNTAELANSSWLPERNLSRHSRTSRVSVGSAAPRSRSAFRLFSELPGGSARVFPSATIGDGELLNSSSSKATAGRKSTERPPTFAETTRREFRHLVATVLEQRVQLLLLYSFASLFHQTYLFNGINYRVFNVRTRGLNCFMYWVGRIPASFFHGHVVDDIRFSTRRRAIHGVILLASHVVICQVLAVVFWMAVPMGHFDVATDPATTAMAFLAFFLYGGLDTVSQSFSLWLFSVLGRKYPSRIPHYVAVFRSFQGFGVALAWFLDLNSFSTSQTQFLVCAFCWVMAFPGLILVICGLTNSDAAVQVVSRENSKYLGSWADSRCAVCEGLALDAAESLDLSTQPSEHAGAPRANASTLLLEGGNVKECNATPMQIIELVHSSASSSSGKKSRKRDDEEEKLLNVDR